ncbi:RNA polymerase sigma factor [Daejeonella oryzae]|uniref:RNA polymerase sigma factor n=1 Tax=Daejeonella oryzae TaxID=1122943 RepID=UPI00041BF6FE|nr:RNA polymerase sigma factor [Daejeonella oryzae]
MELNDKSLEYQLWASFKSGDKAAFKAIYYKYYILLFRFGLKTSTDEDLVEDCLQDLFLKLWNNRENLADVVSIKHYLFRALKHTLYDALKKAGRTYRGVDLPIEESEVSIEEKLINDQSGTEINQHLHTALKHLSKRQKQVVVLYYFEGLSYKQIAEIIPIKYQAIRNCVHEAVKVLRKNMEGSTFFTVMLANLLTKLL